MIISTLESSPQLYFWKIIMMQLSNTSQINMYHDFTAIIHILLSIVNFRLVRVEQEDIK